MRRILIVLSVMVLTGALVGSVAYRAGIASDATTTAPRLQPVAMPGFTKVAFLSHVNNPDRTPLFPGDPAFTLRTTFTIANDGFFLQTMTEGEHTGTHYSAPCHFHLEALCANDLGPADMVLPAVVIDVREQVRRHPEYHATVDDLRDWRERHGAFPADAAVLLRTGCDRWWGSEMGPRMRTYYNCGSTGGGLRQPGFSEKAVRWLLDRGVLGSRGALGSDTFGPDPSDDPTYVASWLTLRLHRLTIENLTNLEALPPTGAWIVVGGPRNRDGSGAPGSVIALIP